MPVRSPWQSNVRLTETTPIHQQVMPAPLVENSIIRTLSRSENSSFGCRGSIEQRQPLSDTLDQGDAELLQALASTL